jgi:hypothetical protein
MAETKKSAKPGKPEQLTYVDMDQVRATYADGFMVASDKHTLSIYFFERQFPHSASFVPKETVQLQASTLKCVARVVLPQNMAASLLDTMAGNQGVVIKRNGSVK